VRFGGELRGFCCVIVIFVVYTEEAEFLRPTGCFSNGSFCFFFQKEVLAFLAALLFGPAAVEPEPFSGAGFDPGFQGGVHGGG